MKSKWYQYSGQEVLTALKSSGSGLTGEEAALLLKEFGKNELQAAPRKSKLSIFISQFKDLMILILIGAALISFFIGERTDAYVILAIIFGNAYIGFSQENNAEESVRMLQKMAAQYAIVLRGNQPQKVDAGNLVPGDVILIEAGDIVPADARILESNALKTEEAALTGESHSVEKNSSPLADEGLALGDQLNMLFKGTIVSNGSGKAVVTATGMQTEIGRIAGLLEVPDQATPLQKRLGTFSKQLSVIVFIICLIVFGYGIWRGEEPLLMFLTALSLAVAALPEALPAVVSIALAGGARRMVGQKALMKTLPAVETLGSVTYICSDKTGTLTQNVMTVERLYPAAGQEELLLKAMMLNNEVRFAEEGLLGDSTETAMVDYALKEGLQKNLLEQEYPLVTKIPFDSERMRMSTLHADGQRWLLLVKGAPARMAEVLSADASASVQTWLDTNREWASEGLRVLFFAYKYFEEKPDQLSESLENDLNVLGMVAMIDPPREEVIEAIRECRDAGIHSVMITGDQPLTAVAIAQRLNITSEGDSAHLTGADLARLSDDELRQKVGHTLVYARVSPEQKLNIVKALQHNGEFVAMTGDGVNDAPSLKQANIGVAMGITGTEVSKEAADMILLDDNFATIVRAVREGRRIYANIKKFVLYVLSCNLGEILVIFFAPVFGLISPLLPIHILWINLVTDGLPGLALAIEPAEKDVMKQPPRAPKESLFAGGMVGQILFTGGLMAAGALLLQQWAAGNGYNAVSQQTMVFTLLCFIQLGNAFCVRLASQSIFSRSIFKNKAMWAAVVLTVVLQLLLVYVPWLQDIFNTTSLGWDIMSRILLVTFGSILFIELYKFIRRKRKNSNFE